MEETAGPKAALRIIFPAACPVRNLDPLARANEEHGVVAHKVAAADRGKADRLLGTRPGMAVAGKDGVLLQIDAESPSDRLAHGQRSTRRRVDLVAMVRLENLHIVGAVEKPCRGFEQLQAHIYPDAHVGGAHDANPGACLDHLRLLDFIKSCGAQDEGNPALDAGPQMAEACDRVCEVDQHIGTVEALRGILAYWDRSRKPKGLASIPSQQRMAGSLKRSDQTEVRSPTKSRNQHLSHATGCAGHNNPDGSLRDPRTGFSAHCHAAVGSRGLRDPDRRRAAEVRRRRPARPAAAHQSAQ